MSGTQIQGQLIPRTYLSVIPALLVIMIIEPHLNAVEPGGVQRLGPDDFHPPDSAFLTVLVRPLVRPFRIIALLFGG
jgi:hypothetical protein